MNGFIHPHTPDDIPICGTTIQTVGPLAKWPGDSPRIPWHVDLAGYRGNLTREQLLAVFALAWKHWADVVEIDPAYVAGVAQAWVRKHFARIDGPSGVLAWSELADNTNRPKTQRYDAGDTWVFTDPAETPSGGIDLVRVACHEIGHVLGLDHDGANADALMRPSYSTRIPKPTARDVQRMVGLGYKRRTSPVPPPPPTSPPTVPPGPPWPDVPPVGPPVPPPKQGMVVVNIDTRTVTIPPGWKTGG